MSYRLFPVALMVTLVVLIATSSQTMAQQTDQQPTRRAASPYAQQRYQAVAPTDRQPTRPTNPQAAPTVRAQSPQSGNQHRPQSAGQHRPQGPGQLGQPVTTGPGVPQAGQPQPYGQRGPTGTNPASPNQLNPNQQRHAGPPFQNSPVEQKFVRQILEMWENRSSQVRTFNAEFERHEYDLTFGEKERPMIRSTGRLTYSKPDRGNFQVKEIFRWKKENPQDQSPEAQGDWQLQKNEIGEHWVCDGMAIYQYDHTQKQLKVTPIPKEMRGEEIVNGPLPFLFGAKANDLEARYWMRSKKSDPATIWLEAFPRWRADAANYRSVDIMLDRKSMLPKALQLHAPNGESRAVYVFREPTVNGKMDGLFGTLFNKPKTPWGWTRVIEEIPAGAPAPHAAPGGNRQQSAGVPALQK